MNFFNFTLWHYPEINYPISIYYYFDDITGNFRASRFKIGKLYEHLKKNENIKELKIEEIEYYNQNCPEEQRLCFYYKLDQENFNLLYKENKKVTYAIGGHYKDEKYDILKVRQFLKEV